MKIQLLKPFYSLKDICDEVGLSYSALSGRAKVMDITPDLIINGVNHYCQISKNKLIGLYEFDKSDEFVNKIEPYKPEFITLDSSMNQD